MPITEWKSYIIVSHIAWFSGFGTDLLRVFQFIPEDREQPAVRAVSWEVGMQTWSHTGSGVWVTVSLQSHRQSRELNPKSVVKNKRLNLSCHKKHDCPDPQMVKAVAKPINCTTVPLICTSWGHGTVEENRLVIYVMGYTSSSSPANIWVTRFSKAVVIPIRGCPAWSMELFKLHQT